MVDRRVFFVDKRSLSSDVAEYIKEKILNGQLNPGERINETKLKNELGISQTPIREAVHRLAGQGILTTISNRGAQVKTLTNEDIFEIYSTRAVLEGLAIRLAVKNATAEEVDTIVQFYEGMKKDEKNPEVKSLSEQSAYIHQYIYQLSKHSLLQFMYKSISFQVSLVNRILGKKYTKEREVAEHKELIDALTRRDPDHAEEVMRDHIFRSYRECVNLTLKDNGDSSNHWL